MDVPEGQVKRIHFEVPYEEVKLSFVDIILSLIGSCNSNSVGDSSKSTHGNSSVNKNEEEKNEESETNEEKPPGPPVLRRQNASERPRVRFADEEFPVDNSGILRPPVYPDPVFYLQKLPVFLRTGRYGNENVAGIPLEQQRQILSKYRCYYCSKDGNTCSCCDVLERFIKD